MTDMKYDYPEGLTTCDHLAHDIRQGRFPERSSISQFICERGNDGLIQPALAPIDVSIDPCDGSIAPSLQYALIQRGALKLLAAEDERQSRLHEVLEVIREQIRLEVAPEHRPDGLFKNIQDAVYIMRSRTPLMNDAAITSALSPAGEVGPMPAVTLAMEEAGREWAREHAPSTFADIFEAMWKAMPKLAHKDGARIA